MTTIRTAWLLPTSVYSNSYFTVAGGYDNYLAKRIIPASGEDTGSIRYNINTIADNDTLVKWVEVTAYLRFYSSTNAAANRYAQTGVYCLGSSYTRTYNTEPESGGSSIVYWEEPIHASNSDPTETVLQVTSTAAAGEYIPVATVNALKPGVTFDPMEFPWVEDEEFKLLELTVRYGYEVEQTASTDPDKPVNVSPADGATGVELLPTLIASSYNHESGTAHEDSEWEIDEGDTLWDESLAAETTYEVADSLAASTEYSWHVRYKDADGNYSDWSDATTFTTRGAPDKPSITSPEDEATDVLKPIALAASAFSDVDDATHEATHWQVDTVNTFDSGSELLDSNTETGTTYSLNGAASAQLYYARVRYQNDAEFWSAWSDTISFTTYDATTPAIVEPSADDETHITQPEFIASEFDTQGDTLTHASSTWHIRDATTEDTVILNSDDASNLESWIPDTELSAGDYEVRVTYTDNLDGTATSSWVAFSVVQLTNSTPADDATNQPPATTLTSPAFKGFDSMSHAASSWRVSGVSGDYSDAVYEVTGSATDLLSTSITTGTLMPLTEYYWQVKYEDNNGSDSGWSTETSFWTGAAGFQHDSFYTPPSSRLRVMTDTFDGETRALKMLKHVEVGGADLRGLHVAAEYKYDTKYFPNGSSATAFVSTPWVPVNEQGIAYLGVCGVDFRIKFYATLQNYSRIDYFTAYMEPVDKRGIRR